MPKSFAASCPTNVALFPWTERHVTPVQVSVRGPALVVTVLEPRGRWPDGPLVTWKSKLL
jgi:hypothetical protein